MSLKTLQMLPLLNLGACAFSEPEHFDPVECSSSEQQVIDEMTTLIESVSFVYAMELQDAEADYSEAITALSVGSSSLLGETNISCGEPLDGYHYVGASYAPYYEGGTIFLDVNNDFFIELVEGFEHETGQIFFEAWHAADASVDAFALAASANPRAYLKDWGVAYHEYYLENSREVRGNYPFLIDRWIGEFAETLTHEYGHAENLPTSDIHSTPEEWNQPVTYEYLCDMDGVYATGFRTEDTVSVFAKSIRDALVADWGSESGVNEVSEEYKCGH